MITGVLFDLDETLLDRTGSLRDFLADQHAHHPALAKTKRKDFIDRFLTLDNRGLTPKRQVYSRLLGRCGTGDESILETLIDEYEHEFCHFAWSFPGLDQLFSDLKARGIRTGIVTNGPTRMQKRSIAALNLERRTEAILISESEGIRKPASAIFLRAAAKIGSRPANCAFVGDNPEADIAGARQAGLKTVWFPNGADWPRHLSECPDAEVSSLREIPQVLDRLGGG